MSGASDMEAGPTPGAPAPVQSPAQTSALRMVGSLAVAGAVAGLLIVTVFDATLDRIEAHKAERLRRAVVEVLHDPARWETLYLVDGSVLREPPAGPAEAEKLYVGLDARGRATGVAVEAAEAGFQDVIELIYGFDPRSGRLLGMKVLESRETPGLGDRIEKDPSFVAQFDGARPPLEAVKRPTGGAGEIDALSGATISSRAVVGIINHSLERVRGPLEAWFGQAAS